MKTDNPSPVEPVMRLIGRPCGTLPSVSAGHRTAAPVENFPVALGLLPQSYREQLLAAYRFARFVDDTGDDFSPGQDPTQRSEALTLIAEDVRRLYAGGDARLPAVAALAPLLTSCGLPAEPLLRLVQANVVDQQVNRYQTFDDLLGYCALSANPVGEMVLHIFGAAQPAELWEGRLELSNRVCTALQLIEHWQDVAEDYRHGRIYLPLDDLARFGVAEPDLGDTTASPQLRALIGFEVDRARAWLDAGAVVVSSLSGWSRLAVSGYVAGGRAAASELRRSGFDPLTGPVKPSGRRIAAAWLQALVRTAG